MAELTDLEKKVIGALLHRGGVYSDELHSYASIDRAAADAAAHLSKALRSRAFQR